jgi:hypothetical protein
VTMDGEHLSPWPRSWPGTGRASQAEAGVETEKGIRKYDGKHSHTSTAQPAYL